MDLISEFVLQNYICLYILVSVQKTASLKFIKKLKSPLY